MSRGGGGGGGAPGEAPPGGWGDRQGVGRHRRPTSPPLMLTHVACHGRELAHDERSGGEGARMGQPEVEAAGEVGVCVCAKVPAFARVRAASGVRRCR